MTRRIVTIAVAALALGACSKTEQSASKAQAKIEAPQAPSTDGRTKEEIDAGLKERLARQEAASRMFEKNLPEPAPVRAAEPKPAEARPAPPPQVAAAAPARLPDPPKAAAEPPKAAPKEAPPEPPKVAAAPAKAPPPSAPVAPPKVETPTAARPESVAAAKPSAPAPAAATRLVSRVDPEFPREAAQAGVERGLVKVRLWLDEAGGVTRVEVLEANPRRVFDRAVVRALSQWKFNDGAAGRSVETEVEFKR